MFSIDHIGVAVKSLATAKVIYEKLGLNLAPEETVEAEQVRVVGRGGGESSGRLQGFLGSACRQRRHRNQYGQRCLLCIERKHQPGCGDAVSGEF